MSTIGEPSGPLDVALARTNKLLKVDPDLAAEQALEILEAVPAYPPALLLLAAARRLLGESAAALFVCEAVFYFVYLVVFPLVLYKHPANSANRYIPLHAVSLREPECTHTND
jgi:hypothetical protein